MTPLRSEEHTSELQSPYDLVCRLLLEKKKKFRVGIKSNISTNRNNLISGVDRCIHINAMKKTTITIIIFFFNNTATTEIYTLSLHDALPISVGDIRLDEVAEPKIEKPNDAI